MITFSMKSNISLDQWINSVNNEKLPPVVKKHAFAIQGQTVANIQKDHLIDTGAFMNGIIAKPIDERNWTVQDSVEYGKFLELGTSRGIRAHHVMGNACEKEADLFFNDVKEALK